MNQPPTTQRTYHGDINPEEMADVLNYLVRLADKLDVNLLEAAREKIELNAKKYPVDKARGSAKKYSDL